MTELLDIGVDIDEVLYDFVGVARDWLRTEGHDHPMPEPQGWDLAKEWGLSKEEFYAAMNKGVDAWYIFMVGEPLDLAAARTWQLSDLGRVHLVTNRNFGTGNEARQITLAWLQKWDITYDSLTFIENKAVGPRCDIYIEDRPRNYDLLEAAGMNPWLYTRPWNIHKRGRRVNNLFEFVEVVEQLHGVRNEGN